MELAARIHAGLELPSGLPGSLDVADIYDGPPSAFPNGCHIAEIEVDPETGIVDVVKYTFVNDFGVIINPLLVDGQAHGGIVQGIGQALRECTVYDEQGQLLTGSYMDYAMPRPVDVVEAARVNRDPVGLRTRDIKSVHTAMRTEGVLSHAGFEGVHG